MCEYKKVNLSIAQCPTTLNNKQHRETKFSKVSIKFNTLHNYTANNRYSNSFFVDGKRKGENCIGFGSLLIFDVDNDKSNLPLEEAIEQCSDFKSLIVTTKSHQVVKNNQAMDRFRIIIPMTDNLELDNKKDYPHIYMYISKLLGITEYIDTACKDVARMYQPNPKQIVHYSNSENIIDTKMIVKSFYERKENETRKNKSFIGKPSNHNSNSKLEYLRSIAYSNTLLKLLNYHEKFVEGYRNTFLYSAGCYLIDSKLTAAEVRETLIWMNEIQNGIPHQELETTVMRSLKL